MNSPRQTDPWTSVSYRGPEHPVVRYFASSKMQAFKRMLAGRHSGLLLESVREQLRILELGAGPGIFTHALLKEFGSVVALDKYESMLRRNAAARRIRADCLHLPVRDGSIDIVFSGNLLHHLEAPVQCLRECRRILKRPDGVLLSVEPNTLHPLMWLFGKLVKRERGLLRFTPGYVERIVEEAGLALEERTIRGQVFQNTTPTWLLPFLRYFDRWNWRFGAYQLSVIRARQ